MSLGDWANLKAFHPFEHVARYAIANSASHDAMALTEKAAKRKDWTSHKAAQDAHRKLAAMTSEIANHPETPNDLREVWAKRASDHTAYASRHGEFAKKVQPRAGGRFRKPEEEF